MAGKGPCHIAVELKIPFLTFKIRKNLNDIQPKILINTKPKGKCIDCDRLHQELTDLKTNHKLDIETMSRRIKTLEFQVKDLEENNTNLKNCNKLLLNDMPVDKITSTDVHSFYQDVFITDLQKEIVRRDHETSDIK